MARIDLVTGFLGAGKTTFLQYYTAYLRRRGVRFAVIENEFGTAGVDAATLKGGGAEIREISGGCICCTLKVGFHDLLVELSGEFERILVEPSGVFNADEFLDVLHSPGLQGRVAPGFAIGVVDPGSLPHLSGPDAAVLVSELIPVGAILLSKVRQYSGNQLAEAGRRVAELLCAAVPDLSREAVEALVRADAWEDLGNEDFAALQRCGFHLRPHVRESADHSTLFQSMTLSPGEACDREELAGILGKVSSALPGGKILRIKGRIPSREGGCYLVNYTPDSAAIIHEAEAPEGTYRLNIIGRGLRRKPIAELFQ